MQKQYLKNKDKRPQYTFDVLISQDSCPSVPSTLFHTAFDTINGEPHAGLHADQYIFNQ